MPNVVRFTLSTARSLFLPGAGQFVAGVLDVDANNLRAVSRARYLSKPYGAVEVGTVDSATPPPALPAVPGPPAPDPYPQYVTDADLDNPASGPSVKLKAASVALVGGDIGNRATVIGAAAGTAFAPIRDGALGNRFVYLGDSIVRGSEIDLKTPISGASGSLAVSWPIFAAYSGGGKIKHVRNLAISGEAAGQALARFDTDVTPWAPDVVHLGYGVNDSSQGGGTVAYQNNIRALVAKVRGIGAKPVLQTITPVTGAGPQQRTYIATWNHWLQRYAAREGIPIVDFASLLIHPPTGNLGLNLDYSSDGTHPNTAAYAMMGKLYADTLAPLLKPQPLPAAKWNTDPTNLAVNGQFLTDTNADGLADNWATYGSPSAGTPAYSIVTDAAAPGGKMQRIAVAGTTGSASIYQAINAGASTFAVGDVINFFCLMSASGINRTQFQLAFFAGGTQIGDLVAFFGQAFTRAPVDITVTVPAGCTTIQVILLAGGGTGNCDFGAVTAFNRTKQSVLTP